MSVCKTLCAIALAGMIVPAVGASVVAEYSTSGMPSTGGAATGPATTVATGITANDLVRGAGINQAGLGGGFSSDHWGVDDGSGGWLGNTTQAQAATNGDYYEWSFTVQPGYVASLSTLDMAMRRSAVAAPDSVGVYASLDNFATPGTEVANWHFYGRSSGTAPATVDPFQWMTTDTPGQNAGNPISTQDLSDDALLQNIPAGTTVTFRLYGWYEGTGTPAITNTFALGRFSDGTTTPATSGGPSIGGTVSAVPEPTTLGLLALTPLGLTRRRRR